MPTKPLPVITAKIEKWDLDVARKITRFQDTPPEVVRVLKAAIKKAHGKQLSVSYTRAKSTPDGGRLYAKGPSLQSAPGWVRRLVAPSARPAATTTTPETAKTCTWPRGCGCAVQSGS